MTEDPSLMLPDERLQSIAALLVLGLERFKQNGGVVSTTPEPKPTKRKEAANDLH